MRTNVQRLPSVDQKSGAINAIIETPKGSRNKYKWDDKKQIYMLSNVLPSGSLFPYDFGFIPSTRADDGDPLDLLLLMEEPAFVGCLVHARLIGVMEAEEDGVRNDRLIAVTHQGEIYDGLKNIQELPKEKIHEIEQFFVAYHHTEGKEFKMLGIRGPKRARRLLDKAHV